MISRLPSDSVSPPRNRQKKLASVSDGAIVGSAIVKIVAKYGKECIPEVEKLCERDEGGGGDLNVQMNEFPEGT